MTVQFIEVLNIYNMFNIHHACILQHFHSIHHWALHDLHKTPNSYNISTTFIAQLCFCIAPLCLLADKCIYDQLSLSPSSSSCYLKMDLSSYWVTYFLPASLYRHAVWAPMNWKLARKCTGRGNRYHWRIYANLDWTLTSTRRNRYHWETHLTVTPVWMVSQYFGRPMKMVIP